MPTGPITRARAVAFHILHDVEAGGYASELLRSRTASLDSRDAGLASELVFGVLRFQAQLDWLIGWFAGRPLVLDPAVRRALRLGVYQLRYLERIPAHAAVDASVELVKSCGQAKAAGLVNAVLRKVNRRPVRWPHRDVEFSHPRWLLERWAAHFGQEACDRIALAGLKKPDLYVRYRGPAVDGLEATEVPGCFRVTGDPPEGARIQDIGSQAIVQHLELAPGQRFLDVCAAPGNKTAQALECGVLAVACDVHPRRLEAVRGADRVVLDATAPLPFGRCFDRILVDAPCSGTGTLARNPEIKWKLQPKDLADLQRRQKLMLDQALAVLRPGGILVYSTCSLEPEENEQVVDGRASAVYYRLPGREAGDGFFAAVLKSGLPVNG